MDRWQDYLYRSHSEAELADWARRLDHFRFCRAIGGHANDGDALLVALRYSSAADLESLWRELGVTCLPAGTCQCAVRGSRAASERVGRAQRITMADALAAERGRSDAGLGLLPERVDRRELTSATTFRARDPRERRRAGARPPSPHRHRLRVTRHRDREDRRIVIARIGAS
jgi:hypothetical protein